VDRVRLRGANTFDYVVQVANAIHAAAPGVHVASASNEAVISGAVNLGDYDTVIWILGEESTADESFSATEQTKVEQFIAGGGNLFVTGAELAWDLDRPSGPTASDRTFFESTLKGNYSSDDANTYNVSAAAGGIFAGLANFSFDDGTLFYNSEFPDVIDPQSGAQAALTYSGGTDGTAAIQIEGYGGRGSVVVFGFPFETITTAANRAAVIDRVFNFFGLAASAPDNTNYNNDDHIDAADYVVWRKVQTDNWPTRALFPSDAAGYVWWRKFATTKVTPGALGDANLDGFVDAGDWLIWREQFGSTPAGAGGAEFQVESATFSDAASATSFNWSLLDSAPSRSKSAAKRTNQLSARLSNVARIDWGIDSDAHFTTRHPQQRD
jgi:hypothetical protein